MKKKLKRLHLTWETLRRLEAGQLERVAGGFTQKPVICCGTSDSCPPPPSAGDTAC